MAVYSAFMCWLIFNELLFLATLGVANAPQLSGGISPGERLVVRLEGETK
jgi:hypothetical protein